IYLAARSAAQATRLADPGKPVRALLQGADRGCRGADSSLDVVCQTRDRYARADCRTSGSQVKIQAGGVHKNTGPVYLSWKQIGDSGPPGAKHEVGGSREIRAGRRRVAVYATAPIPGFARLPRFPIRASGRRKNEVVADIVDHALSVMHFEPAPLTGALIGV